MIRYNLQYFGGRGASTGTGKIEKINNVKRQLKSARANESRKRRAYLAASGAVVGFDKETKKTNPAKYEKAVANESKAKKAYNDAIKKTDKLEKQLKKLSKTKKDKNAPLF